MPSMNCLHSRVSTPTPCRRCLGTTSPRLTKRQTAATAAAAAASTAPEASPSSSAGLPVLVQDGAVVQPAPATAQQLLSQHRGWSYTTALVRHQYEVLDWELHLQRLIRNMHILAQQRPPAYAGFLQWQQQHHQDNPGAVLAALQQLVNPMVATALQQLGPSSSQAAAAEQQQVMLTVALGDRPDLPQHHAPSTAAAGQPPLSVLVWAKPLPPAAPTAAKVLVAGAPRPAAQAKHCEWVVARQPLEQQKQAAGVDELLLSDSQGGLLEGLVSNFYVLADAQQLAACGALPPGADAASPADAAAGATAAGGEDGAASKLHRQQHQQDPLHASKQHHEGQRGLQEGQQQQQQQQQQQHPGRAVLEGLVLLTAGPGVADAALPGVVQQRVLQACRVLQLPVVLQAPRGDSRAAGAWREAFLTNCVRGLQPVGEARLADGEVWTASGSAAAIALLQQEVQALQTATDMQQWLR